MREATLAPIIPPTRDMRMPLPGSIGNPDYAPGERDALIVRIKDDGNGYENAVWGDWGLEGPQFVVPFRLNGRPYLFETKGRNARIARVDFDPSTEQVTGWTYVYENPLSAIPSNCAGPAAAAT